MSSVVVRKSSPVLVRPSWTPPAGDTIHLLPCERAFSGTRNTALLVFTESTMHDPVESIRRALSHTLVYYHGFAGRIIRHDDGGEEAGYRIACNGNGMSFVAATADCSVEDVRFFNRSVPTSGAPPSWMDDLALIYPVDDGDWPLVMMQVTEFSSGGFVVGVTWNHGVADGTGIGQFMRAVGDLARGLQSPSVPPVTRQEYASLAALVPPSSSVLAIGRLYQGLAAGVDMALLDITIPSSIVNGIRSRGGDGRRTVTVFEAVTAVLWRCYTRAIMSLNPERDPITPTVLYFSVDMRKYAGAKDGYYGNCVNVQRAVATSGEVACGEVMDLVGMIQNAKHQIRLPDVMENQKLEEEKALDLDRTFILTSWRNLGFDDVDFGGGKPTRVLSSMQGLLGVGLGPPTNIVTGNGDAGGCNVLSRCLKEYAQAFLYQLATFTI